MKRNENISKGKLAYEQTKSLLESACMSTEEMRKLAKMEEVLWLVFGQASSNGQSKDKT